MGVRLLRRPPLCKCGCRRRVTRHRDTKKWNTYCHGHNYTNCKFVGNEGCILLLYSAGMTVKDVANHFNVCVTVVNRVLHKFGVEIRRSKQAWNKGVPCKDETKKKLSLINTGKKQSEDTIEKRRKSLIGKKQRKQKILTEEHKLHIAQGLQKTKEEGKNIGRLKGGVSWNKGLTKETDPRVAINAERSGKTIKEQYANGRVSPFKGKTKTRSHRMKLALANIGKKQSDESKRKSSEKHKILWQLLPDSEKLRRIKHIMKRNQSRPNKPERELLFLLNQLYKDEWKYVGDGQVIIAGKNPDFINVNGQKKIIELFGDYWHRGDDPKDRIDLFKQYGYDALVIWGSELDNYKKLSVKIEKFVKQ